MLQRACKKQARQVLEALKHAHCLATDVLQVVCQEAKGLCMSTIISSTASKQHDQECMAIVLIATHLVICLGVMH